MIPGAAITPGNEQLMRADGRLAVALLLDSEDAGFHALIAPGHVSTVMGSEEWEFVLRDHHLSRRLPGITADRHVLDPPAGA